MGSNTTRTNLVTPGNQFARSRLRCAAARQRRPVVVRRHQQKLAALSLVRPDQADVGQRPLPEIAQHPQHHGRRQRAIERAGVQHRQHVRIFEGAVGVWPWRSPS